MLPCAALWTTPKFRWVWVWAGCRLLISSSSCRLLSHAAAATANHKALIGQPQDQGSAGCGQVNRFEQLGNKHEKSWIPLQSWTQVKSGTSQKHVGMQRKLLSCRSQPHHRFVFRTSKSVAYDSKNVGASDARRMM
jgi:hypothetical protein